MVTNSRPQINFNIHDRNNFLQNAGHVLTRENNPASINKIFETMQSFPERCCLFSGLRNSSNDTRKLDSSAFVSLSDVQTNHKRIPRNFTNADRELLNKNILWMRVDEETPPQEKVQSLSESADPKSKQLGNYLRVRHYAKKGTDILSDYISMDGFTEKGSKETVPNRLQTANGVALRAEAGIVAVENYPNKITNKATDEVKFFENILVHLKDELNNDSEQPIIVKVVVQRRDPKAYDSNTNFLAVMFQSSVRSLLEQQEVFRQMDHSISILDAKAKNTTLPNKTRKIIFEEAYHPVISRTIRSNASPIGRIVQQGQFGVGSIKKGDHVIFVDDHIEAGGAAMAAYTALKNAGANLIGFATFGIHPFSAQGLFSPELQNFLSNFLEENDSKGKIFSKLKESGISFENLTNYEVFVLLCTLVDPHSPSKQEIIAKMQEVSGGFIDQSGKNSLEKLLESEAVTVDSVCAMIDQEISNIPNCVEDAVTSKIVFYDYDDTLTNEFYLIKDALVKTLTNKIADGGFGFDEEKSQAILGDDSSLETMLSEVNRSKINLLPKLLESHSAEFATYFNLQQEKPGVNLFEKSPNAQFKRKFMRQYNQLVIQHSQLSESAHTVLNATRRPDTQVVLISSKPSSRLTKHIYAGNVQHYFDIVKGADSVTFVEDQKAHIDEFTKSQLNDSHACRINAKIDFRLKRKPSSAIYIEAIKELPVPKDSNVKLIGIGDMLTDGIALRGLADYGYPKANMHFIYVGGRQLNQEQISKLDGINVYVAKGENLEKRQQAATHYLENLKA